MIGLILLCHYLNPQLLRLGGEFDLPLPIGITPNRLYEF